MTARTTPIPPAAEALIARTVGIVKRVLRCQERELPPKLHREAFRLLTDHVFYQRAYRRANGAKAVSPTTRAWYLLREMMEHVTLLKYGEPPTLSARAINHPADDMGPT